VEVWGCYKIGFMFAAAIWGWVTVLCVSEDGASRRVMFAGWVVLTIFWPISFVVLVTELTYAVFRKD